MASWLSQRQMVAPLISATSPLSENFLPDVGNREAREGQALASVFSGMARAIIHNSDFQSADAAKGAIDGHFENRNEHFRKYPKRAGRKIWGAERVQSEFLDSNNCKDPLYR
jgi:hypothetical protein